MSRTTQPAAPDSNAITQALRDLVSRIPASDEPVSSEPKGRAQSIAKIAAIKAAAISGALAIPPGPLGLATVIPDLVAIWRVQQSMVADIAACYGKSAYLGKEAMIYCLFKHAGAALVRDIVARAGERYLVRRTSLKAVQDILRKVGARVTQRVLGKSISRWIPIIGALGVGAYAYADTAQVAASAIELFSKDLELEGSVEKKAVRGGN